MLFANLYNAIESFVNCDTQTVGNVLNILYASSANRSDSTVSVQIGNTTVSWDEAQIGNTTYQNTFFDQLSLNEIYALLIAVFIRIFNSYSVEPPASYDELVESLGDKEAPDINDVTQLLELLFAQFSVAAITYLAACVSDSLKSSNRRPDILSSVALHYCSSGGRETESPGLEFMSG